MEIVKGSIYPSWLSSMVSTQQSSIGWSKNGKVFLHRIGLQALMDQEAGAIRKGPFNVR